MTMHSPLESVPIEGVADRFQQAIDGALHRTELLLLEVDNAIACHGILQSIACSQPERLAYLRFEPPAAACVRQDSAAITVHSLIRRRQEQWRGMPEELMARLLSIGIVVIDGLDGVLARWHCQLSRMLSWCAYNCILTVAVTRSAESLSVLDLPNVSMCNERIAQSSLAQIDACQAELAALIGRMRQADTDAGPEGKP